MQAPVCAYARRFVRVCVCVCAHARAYAYVCMGGGGGGGERETYVPASVSREAALTDSCSLSACYSWWLQK